MLAWRFRIGGAKQPDRELLDKAQRLLALRDQARSPPTAPRGLTVVDDNGLMRVRGRLVDSVLARGVSCPVLLAPAELAMAMLKECHQSLLHCPARQVLHHVHVVEGAYISKGQRLAQRMVEACPVCRRINQRIHPQPLAPLPALRHAPGGPPFTSVAVDFLETEGRRKKKKAGGDAPDAGALFMIIVCDVTRAVHLEIAGAESADAVVRAWTRFVCRRGVWPKQVVADAGKGLTAAAKRLRQWTEAWAKAVREDTPDGEDPPQFVWRTGVPRAPHRMGVVEALVKSVKRGLRVGATVLAGRGREDWETLACKAAFLINSRPCDPRYWSDLGQTPITANSILYPYGQVSPIKQDPYAYAEAAE